MRAVSLRGAVLVLAVLLSACAGVSGDAGPPKAAMISGQVTSHRLLDMNATLHRTTVTVTNRNDFAWRDCNVQINIEDPDLNPFEHAFLQRVPSGEPVVLDLFSFTREEGGLRFVNLDPDAFHDLPGKRLILSCETPNGSGFSEAEFGRLRETLPYGPGVELRVPYEYVLYTHCGILGARIDGREWDAHPPLFDDYGANPPPGWGNPFDQGTMMLLTRDDAEFRSASGETARFRPRPPNGDGPAVCK
jgi:hypothetical protein